MAKDSSPAPKRQFNVTIPAGLAQLVRHRAVDDDTSISALVDAALRAYLDLPRNGPALADTNRDQSL